MRVKGIKTIVIVVAAAMVLFASIGAALAYFSDYDKAAGDKQISLYGETRINENPSDDSKTISIENVSKDNVSMIVRAKVIGPVKINFDKGANWVEEDGWWYYTKVLAKGDSTTNLVASWQIPADSDLEIFDVVVVHESAIATYDASKNVIIPDGWASDLTIQGE